MSTPLPIAFEITRIGQEPERIEADSVETQGAPSKYVFRKDRAVVRELFVHALEIEPKPIFPQTPQQKAAWRKFTQKANAPSKTPYLKRD